MPVELGTDMAREDAELRFGVAHTLPSRVQGGYTGDCDRTHGCRPVPTKQ